MTTVSPQEITRLLADWANGDREALDKLTPLVHSELRRIARRQMSGERQGHTLQATALVNEAYLKLSGREGFEWHDRAHFFAVCAQVMRHILIDHARTHSRDKRGGGAVQVSLDEVAVMGQEQTENFVALDEALRALEALDPQKGRIVELRYFAGLSLEETAEVLKISVSTVRREWRRAKAWLYRAITEGGADETRPLARS
ncbi:MAG TPA: sigma-70 family RNA polymerase sigma factor [Pyrinomonadaceae bacterium]|nr:sigma-70 family RNA polymerase sigma factor [Pyrinomonadaceae bacterium]